MPTEKFEFQNDAGHILRGELHHAPGRPKAVAIFAHCFTCTAKSKAAIAISRRLAALGISSLRFDFTGLGESEGAFGDSNFSSSVEDVIAAALALEQKLGRVDLLIGHSLGGTAVLSAALRLPQVKAVATIGAPAQAEHVGKLIVKNTRSTDGDDIQVELGGQPFTIKRQLFDDLAAQSMPERVAELRCALLVMHAPLDDIVEISNASEIFLEAMHPKSFVSLDHADHLLSKQSDAEYAADMVATWSRPYTAAAAAEQAVSISEHALAETGERGFVTMLQLAGHELIADEPRDLGGDALGPSPYDLLSGALAACTSMTLQMYARHKGLPLERAITRVRHDKVHATECAECETKEGRIDRFDREVELVGPLDDAARKRFLEIADRCPVHKTLTAGAVVVTSSR